MPKKSQPNKTNKVMVTLQCDAELKKMMETKARENDRPLSLEIIRAMKFYLKYAQTHDVYVGNNSTVTIPVPTISTLEKEVEQTADEIASTVELKQVEPKEKVEEEIEEETEYNNNDDIDFDNIDFGDDF